MALHSAGQSPPPPAATTTRAKAKAKVTKSKAKAGAKQQKTQAAVDNQQLMTTSSNNKLLDPWAEPTKAPLNGLNSKQAPQRSLVEELKLFQNNQLLNQLDPIEQLHRQLSELTGSQPLIHNSSGHPVAASVLSSAVQSKLQAASNSPTPTTGHLQHTDNKHHDDDDNVANHESGGFTVKKGVLWEQQNYDKFHRRLFSRWKKRYFILTSDYLVCFQRSASRVGRSEMGKFIYKTALNDVTKTDWLKPGKSDKGPIAVHVRGHSNLLLWCKENLGEWMFMLAECVQRNKIRRLISLRSDEAGFNVAGLATTDHCNGLPGLEKLAAKELSMLFSEKPVEDQQGGVYENCTAIAPAACTGDDDTNNNNNNITNTGNSNEVEPAVCAAADAAGLSDSLNRETYPSSGSATQEVGNQENRVAPGEPPLAVLEETAKLALPISNLQSADHTQEELASSTTAASGGKEARRKGSLRKQDSLQSSSSRGSSAAAADISSRTKQSDKTEPAANKAKSKSRPKSMAKASSGEILEQQSPETTDEAGSIERKLRPAATQNADSGESKSSSSSSSSSEVRAAHSDLVQQAPEVDSAAQPGGRGGSPIVINELACNDKQRQRRQSEEDGGSDSKSGRPKGGPAKVRRGARRRSDSVEESSGATDSLGSCSQATATLASARSSLGKQAGSGAAFKQPETKQDNSRKPAPANLIRRDDSWQSLVSLTRVVPLSPSTRQVPPRSLYAQHIMPDGSGPLQQQQQQLGQHQFAAAAGRLPARQQFTRQELINIESTATPSRGLLFRQYSIQSQQLAAQRLRMHQQSLPEHQPHQQQQQQQRSSLVVVDAGRCTPAQLHQNGAPPAPPAPRASYQDKLTQLQLLHNSNNVDYIRHNNAGNTSDDYQVYTNGGCAPIGSSLYGYSSMRSNLKSVASEFSFIRPSPSAMNHVHPLEPHVGPPSPRTGALLTSSQESPSIRSSLPVGGAHQLIKEQHLVNPVTGERLVNIGGESNVLLATAPTRELPLKPNKRRTTTTTNGDMTTTAHQVKLQSDSKSLPKSFSLGASIACFFRRTFLRGSSGAAASKTGCRRKSAADRKKSNKKKGSSQLAESCSSSLAMFDESSYPASVAASSRPALASAFSTGSKSMVVAAAESERLDRKQPQPQQPRMIDMIEAFTAGPASFRESSPLPVELGGPQQEPARTSGGRPEISQPQSAGGGWHQFGGSPLHKSNSISATMGLSHHESPLVSHRGSQLNSAAAERQFLMGSPKSKLQQNPASLLSPLASSNTHNKSLARYTNNQFQQQQQQQQQQVVGPRSPRLSTAEHLPRPSSIYGQPSMTGSPVISGGSNREERSNNFGLHRNSMHGTTSSSQLIHASATPNFHHHMQLNRRHLNATCEQLAEEPGLSQANAAGDNVAISSDFSLTNSSPYQKQRSLNILQAAAGGRHTSLDQQQQQQHHKAMSHASNKEPVASAILHQSPTMHAIYDNHPMLLHPITSGIKPHTPPPPPTVESHYDNPQFQAAFAPARSPRSSTSMSHITTSIKKSQDEPLYCRRKLLDTINNNNFHTPMHIRLLPQSPTTNTTTSANNNNSNTARHDLLTRRQVAAGNAAPETARSPVLVGRNGSKHSFSHYQQSPLVSQQTRIIQRRDGVQATTVSSVDTCIQPAVVIAGAPGVTLEPSLAASLLRGTNIDAYECSTLERSSWGSNHMNNEKTFLVSTRLSKTIANQKHKSSSINTSTTEEEEILADNNSNQLGVFDECAEKNWIHSKLVD